MLLFVSYLEISERLSRIEFKSDIWSKKIEMQKPPYLRIKMVDSLLSKYKFDNWSKEKVIKFLGNPEETDYFENYDLVYWLGAERGFISIDSEWLVFKLNSNLLVYEYHIVSD